MKRREFLLTSATLTAGTLAGQRLTAADAPAANGGPIVSGSGDFRYEYVPTKLVLPPEAKMRNGHGLCLDHQGNIFFTFEPEKVEPQTRCLVKFAPDGTNPTLLGPDNALAPGTPHGLTFALEAGGQGALYHANNDGTVHKTNLAGEILWTRKWPALMGNYRPTDIAVLPEGGRIMVADGYGSNMIHALKTADGVYAGKSWGGTGKQNGELSCPHAITYDPRRQQLLICDRSNQRLQYYSADGFYQSTVQLPEMKAPCNTDFRGEFVLVPNLDGPVLVLNKDNQTVSVIEVAKLLGAQGFVHPHDAIWLANGDLAVCTWNPGRISYWRKLPPS
jgi:hypothetical protein